MIDLNGVGEVSVHFAMSSSAEFLTGIERLEPMVVFAAHTMEGYVETAVPKVCKIVKKYLADPHCNNGTNPMIQQQMKVLESRNIKPGRHNLHSPVAGSRADELREVQKMIRIEPVLEKLEKAIYEPENVFLIPIEKKAEADQIAKELFLNYIAKWQAAGYTEQNIVEWNEGNFRAGVMSIYDVENEWNTWTLHARVAEGGSLLEQDGQYLPPYVVAYHELMHVEETPKCAKDEYPNKGDELLTTIKTIILQDHIYKKIHNLDETSEVDYGKFIGTISLGAFANFYRRQEAIHGTLSRALICPESIAFLKTMTFV